MTMTLFDVARLLLLLTGAALLAWGAAVKLRPGSLAFHWNRALLGVVAMLSVLAYTRFGGFHEYGIYGRHTYHYHEIFHYYFGAKYFPELGYHNLYDCTHVALSEIGKSGTEVPRIQEIRSLQYRFEYRTAEQVLVEKAQSCRQTFGDERWGDFRADLRTMLSFGWEEAWWQTMLFDLGLNPPPSWAAVAYPLANLVPLNRGTIEGMPFLDMGLIFGVAGFFILQAFGFNALCGYLIVFGNNWLSDYLWTGGSFFRQEWFFLLAMGLCGLKRRRYLFAGAFFGLSASMRVFPLFFAAGALIALARRGWRDPSKRRNAIQFAGGGVAAGTTMCLLSLALFRVGLWPEFFANILQHNRTLFVMHIGFDKIAVYAREFANQNFWYGPGLVRFSEWNLALREAYARHSIFFGAVKALALFTGLTAAWRCRPATASLFFGWTILFFFNVPANYYYVFLALLPLAYLDKSAPVAARDLLRLVALFALLVFIPFAPSMERDHIVHNALINWGIFIAFVVTGTTMIPSRFLRKLPMIFREARRRVRGAHGEEGKPEGNTDVREAGIAAGDDGQRDVV